VWREAGYATPVKRRVLAGSAHSVKQQVVRVDRGGGRAVPPEGTPLLPAVRQAAVRAQGVLISDYSLGLLNPGTIDPVMAAVRDAGRPLFVDSRSQLRLFRGAAAATPNLQEAEEALGDRVGDSLDALGRAGTLLREEIDAGTIVIT